MVLVNGNYLRETFSATNSDSKPEQTSWQADLDLAENPIEDGT